MLPIAARTCSRQRSSNTGATWLASSGAISLSNRSEVVAAYTVTGDHDALAHLRVRDTTHLAAAHATDGG